MGIVEKVATKVGEVGKQALSAPPSAPSAAVGMAGAAPQQIGAGSSPQGAAAVDPFADPGDAAWPE
jgi:hypothetical protein